MLEVANLITVGLLPERIRQLYGFSWDPARRLAAASGRETARRVIPFLPPALRYAA